MSWPNSAPLLTPSMYARLHLNQWVAGEDRLTTPEEVRSCVGHSGVLPPQTGRAVCPTGSMSASSVTAPC